MLFNKRWGNTFYSADNDAVSEDVEVTKENKTFLQEDVDRIVTERLERQKAKHAQELEEVENKIKKLGFNDLDEIAKIKSEKQELEEKLVDYEQKIAKAAREKKVKDLGVDERFVDFILFQVKNDEDLENFIKENPRFISENFNKRSSNFDYRGGPTRKLADAASDEDYLRIRRKEENK